MIFCERKKSFFFCIIVKSLHFFPNKVNDYMKPFLFSEMAQVLVQKLRKIYTPYSQALKVNVRLKCLIMYLVILLENVS